MITKRSESDRINRRRFLSLTSTAAAGLLAGCLSNQSLGPQQPSVPPAGGADQWHGRYTGSAEVSTALVEYANDQVDRYIPTNEYRVAAELYLGDPVTTDVNTEENPLSLLATSNLSATGMIVGGDFFIASALIFSTEDYPRPSVVQAWNLSLQGTTLVGSLDANRRIVSNLFFEASDQPSYIEVELGPSPYTFPYGTGIRATRTGGGVSMVVHPPSIGVVTDGANQVAYAAEIRMELVG